MVSHLRKVSAVIEAPTETPRKIVTMLSSASSEVFKSLSTTPHSRKRFPSMSIPMRGAAEGRRRPVSSVVMMGKRMRTGFSISFSCIISRERSSLFVSAFMMGGCIMGTSAI